MAPTPTSTDAADVRVSVVIPSYNAAATLPEALGSVLAQSRPATEVIVVDDGSTDASAEVLAAYGDRIRVVSQANGGLAAARNAGIEAATGDLIAFMDADDVCPPDRFATQLACHAADPSIVLSHGDFSAFGEGMEEQPRFHRAYYSAVGEAGEDLSRLMGAKRSLALPDADGRPAERIDLHVGEVYEAIVHGNFVHPPTMMFQRALYDEIGPFDTRLRNMCDWDWIVRASRFGAFAFIDRPLLRYRLSATQMSGALHRVTASRDTVRIYELILARDPALWERERARFRRALGDSCLDAADALADSDTAATLHMLAKSLAHRTLSPRTFKVMSKALIPASAKTYLRAARQRRRGAA